MSSILVAPSLRACASADVGLDDKDPTCSPAPSLASTIWSTLAYHFNCRKSASGVQSPSSPILRPSLTRSVSHPPSSYAVATVQATIAECKEALKLSVNTASTSAAPSATTCGVCMESKSSKDLLSICSRQCEARFCSTCINTYLKHEICRSYGMCRSIKCPGCMYTTTYTAWSAVANLECKKEYNKRAENILTLQCGSCHNRRTMFVTEVTKAQKTKEKRSAFVSVVESMSDEKISMVFEESLDAYVDGDIDAVAFYTKFLDLVRRCSDTTKLKAAIKKLRKDKNRMCGQLKHWKKTNKEFRQLGKQLRSVKKERTAAYKLVQSYRKTDQLDLQQLQQVKANLAKAINEEEEKKRKEEKQQEKGLSFAEKIKLAAKVIKREKSPEEKALEAEAVASLVALTAGLQGKESQMKDMVEKQRVAMGLSEVQAQLAESEKMLKASAKVSDTLFSQVLQLLVDPERRASFQLKHYLEHPAVKSPCCGYNHCFRCKIKGTHSTKEDCAKYQAALCSDVKQCTKCGIYLVKGDGCNSIRCVCGHSFDWGALKKVDEPPAANAAPVEPTVEEVD